MSDDQLWIEWGMNLHILSSYSMVISYDDDGLL